MGLGVWTPHIRHANGELECLLPGYAFMPEDRWPLCELPVRWRYRLRPLHPSGQDGACTVGLEALHRMQEAALTFATRARAGKPPPLRVGQRVEFIVEPFRGMVAQVTRIRANSVRVLMGARYVTTTAAYLRPLQ